MQLRGQNGRSVSANRERTGHAENRLARGTGNQRQTDRRNRINRDLGTDTGQVVVEEERGCEQHHRADEITPPRQGDRSATTEERAGKRFGFNIDILAE